jgi:hypothetical protein
MLAEERHAQPQGQFSWSVQVLRILQGLFVWHPLQRAPVPLQIYLSVKHKQIGLVCLVWCPRCTLELSQCLVGAGLANEVAPRALCCLHFELET